MAEQEKYNAVFPTRLRDLIKKRGTTITALSKELGISRQAVSQYADGTGQPNIDKLVLIAKFFNVSTDYLSGLTEYQSVKSESILAKDLGLSEQAVNVLKSYADFPEYPSFIATLNDLIKQETPPPDFHSFGIWDGMSEQEYAAAMREAETKFDQDLEAWRNTEYFPILSTIDSFLSVDRSDTKYDLLGNGQILRKKEGKGLSSIRIDAIRTVKSSDIVERILLSEIESKLKELKKRRESDGK